MSPPREGTRGPKVKVGVSLDPDLHAWAMQRVGPGKEYSTLTHAIERGLALLRERETELSTMMKRGADGDGAKVTRRRG